jgi:hypothetical protein
MGRAAECECVLSGLTRLASPGDVVTVDGVFYRSDWRKWFRAMVAGLIFDNVLGGAYVVVHKVIRRVLTGYLVGSWMPKSWKWRRANPIGRLSRSVRPNFLKMRR